MKKIIFIIIMTAIILPTTMAGTIKLYPTHDAYTDHSEPNNNFDNFQLKIGYDSNTGKHRTYLKFDLSQLDGLTINNAVLSIDPIFTSNHFNAELYYVPSDSWNEGSVTWNNAPIPDQTITDSKLINSGNRVDFNIMSLINEPDNILSVVLVSTQESTSNVYTQTFSTNGGDNSYWPYIEVEVDGELPECNTDADTNCDSLVSFSELSLYANKWVDNLVSFSELIEAANAWVNS